MPSAGEVLLFFWHFFFNVSFSLGAELLVFGMNASFTCLLIVFILGFFVGVGVSFKII